MDISDFLAFLPDDLKFRLRDGLVDAVAGQTEKMPGGDKVAKAIRQFSSQATFNNAFDKAMKGAVRHFVDEYMEEDEDLVEAILSDGAFWQSKDIRESLIELVRRPGAWLKNEQNIVVQHFSDVLPRRVNRKRVDKALNFLLHCILEEMWTLPGVGEVREIYKLQFQKLSAETARQQVTLLEAQLQATARLNVDVRQALLQLASTLEQRLLPAPSQTSTNVQSLYHNLPHPDYTNFIGRQKELDWLYQRLAPSDRVWQMVIIGIGGVGKSSLALAIAHDYHKRYNELPLEERFEAIIWVSAKEEVLTIDGKKKSVLAGLTFRSLEDVYTTIAQTLEREDITRTQTLDGQHALVYKALSSRRTLLIVDNLESVTDDRVRAFLRHNLPLSTKCVITSRDWVDVADVLRLQGLPREEAEKMIIEEATVRNVILNAAERERLFELTSGLPLPIKLSLARMASDETFEQVVRWLGNYSTGDLPDYCVKEQIAMARKRNPNALKLLLACTLFDQNIGASREALEFIADLPLTERDNGLTLLQRLSLLNPKDANRFWALPIVQKYAEAILLESDSRENLVERWLKWLLDFTKHYGIDLEFHVERAPIFELEYPNLLHALRWCREHERWEMLLQLMEGMWFFPYLASLYSEFREILEAGLQGARALQDEQCEGRCMRRLGQLLWVQEQYDQAHLEYLNKAKEIAHRYQNEVEIGRIDNIHSDILFSQGRLEEAEKLEWSMLEMGKRLNNLELITLATYGLSRFNSEMQQFDKALEWIELSEEACRELNWSRILAWIIYRRGLILIGLGNNNAEIFLLESLSMATSWKEHHLTARIKERLAQVYSNTNRLEFAHQMAEDARNLYERLGMIELSTHMEELIREWT